MKAMVTGAGGMLARALVPALEAAGHRVFPYRRADLDVTQMDAIRHAVSGCRPDWVFHLAAYTRVHECESRPDHAHLVNGLGARNAALAAAETGAAVLLVSSDYVFDGKASHPYREYDAPDPLNVYGASKLAGERGTIEVNPRHMIVRTSWLYGRGGINFPDTILARAREGQPLRVVKDQRGSPTWTEDLAPMLVRLAATGQYGTYHCTNFGECTWYEFTCFLMERMGFKTEVEAIDSVSLGRTATRPAYSVLVNQLAEHVTGMRMPTWQDAAGRYLASLGDGPQVSGSRRGRGDS